MQNKYNLIAKNINKVFILFFMLSFGLSKSQLVIKNQEIYVDVIRNNVSGILYYYYDGSDFINNKSIVIQPNTYIMTRALMSQNITGQIRIFIDENNNGIPDQNEYDLFVSKDFANKVINNKCFIDIPILEQNPIGTFLNQKRCFNFDIAGNNTNSVACSTNITNPVSNEYSDSVLEEIKNSIDVAPNPTSTTFTVYIKGIAQGKISGLNVISTDMSYSNKINIVTNQHNYTVDLTSKISGIYVIQFTLNTGQVFTKSIIKA